MIHDSAHTINLEGQLWVIGAVWSESTYDRCPRNLYKLTEELGFAPERSMVAHIPSTSQLGWYEFKDAESRPKRAGCLSHVLVEQAVYRASDPADQFQLPAVIILNLGEYAWLTILDHSGALVPEYERCGSMEGLLEFLQADDAAGVINAYRTNEKILPDAEEATAWLFRGDNGRHAYAEQIQAPSSRTGVMAAGGAVALGLGLAAGWYHHREAQKQLALEEQALWVQQSESAAAAAKAALDHAEAERKFNERLKAYWASYPRPWLGAGVPSAEVLACETYVVARPLTVEGWERSSASCSFNGTAMAVTEVWSRGDLATVLRLPTGAEADSDGNTAHAATIIKLPPVRQSGGQQAGVPVIEKARAAWMAEGQAMPDTFTVKVAPAVSFKPPVPSFVKPSQVAEVQARTPILWTQSAIELATAEPPSDGWSALEGVNAFVLEALTVTYSDTGITWDMKGTQYGQP